MHSSCTVTTIMAMANIGIITMMGSHAFVELARRKICATLQVNNKNNEKIEENDCPLPSTAPLPHIDIFCRFMWLTEWIGTITLSIVCVGLLHWMYMRWWVGADTSTTADSVVVPRPPEEWVLSMQRAVASALVEAQQQQQQQQSDRRWKLGGIAPPPIEEVPNMLTTNGSADVLEEIDCNALLPPSSASSCPPQLTDGEHSTTTDTDDDPMCSELNAFLSHLS